MLDRSVPMIGVILRRSPAGHHPRYSLPEGYTLSGYRDGYDAEWARIMVGAGEFDDFDKAKSSFYEQFPETEMLPGHCLFALDPDGVPAATAAMWTGDKLGPVLPRLHWVATDPAHEGRGLCKALLTAALDIAAAEYPGQPIYLTTQSCSWRAIRLYLRFGFEPILDPLPNWTGHYRGRESWRIIRGKIDEFENSKSK